jgi:hypothetical protein
LGLGAGALTPFAEPFVRQAMESVALSKIPIEQTEMDLLTLVLLLLAAAMLSGGGSSFALLLGALIGCFRQTHPGCDPGQKRRRRMIPGEVMTARGRDRAERGPARDHVDGCQHG